MNHSTNQDYLLNSQYKTASNLNARAHLHKRYSTNPQPWCRWVFDRLLFASPPPDASVLELGCGPAGLWQENLDRLPAGWEVTLTDFSPGMLEEARANLTRATRAFRFEQVDAQRIPREAARFDVVIANHMLYHVPDRAAAFAEIRRVLRPGGRLLAATNGAAHMRELWDMLRQCVPDLAPMNEMIAGFTLENGRGQLEQHFGQVRLHLYEDALEVTAPEPLIAYALSSKSYGLSSRPGGLGRFARLVRQRLALDGAIHIGKATGLFEASTQ
jgi:SAM-dependent methyltransferase